MSEVFDLRSARLNRGLSVKVAAAEIGVHAATLRRLEDGVGIPHPANAKKIADFFGIQVTDLIPLEEAA